MYIEINPILFRRKSKILVDLTENREVCNDSIRYVVSLMKNIEEYGYTLSVKMFTELTKLTVDEISILYSDLITEIKKLTGANNIYKPMYPNFPKQVAEADYSELVLNALIHYWSFGTLLPEYTKDERFPLVYDTKLKVIDTGCVSDLITIERNLLASKTNISQQDKDDLTVLLDYLAYYPSEIPNKEIAAFYCCHVLNSDVYFDTTASHYIKTATDILRLVTCMSGGDISLATNTKFIKLKRKYRRFIVDCLADIIGSSGIESCLEDMFRYRERWVRIGEIVHPSEYGKQNPEYNKVSYLFEKLRANDKPLFFGGKVEKAIKEHNAIETVNLLAKRPSEFGRRLDYLLREFPEEANLIADKFARIAPEISTTVLWGIIEHFKTRTKNDYRVFFPKGNISKFYVIDNKFEELNDNDKICHSIITSCYNALIQNYSRKSKLGKVYIDEELKNYVVPFSQRSASSSSKILTRGSKLKLNDSTNIIRAFIWWTNTKNSRVDLDLSCGIYDDDLQLIKHISYTNLKSNSFHAYHSGDIVNGGDINDDGVAEFIDIDVNEIASKARYVVFQVYSFTTQPFNSLPNCHFGWMNRNDFNSGEIFEPKTVENVIGLTSNSIFCAPVIFDCKEKTAIWCDIQFQIGTNRGLCNNLETNAKNTDFVLYAMTHLCKPNMYELITFNALARGSIVKTKEEADVIFSATEETFEKVEQKVKKTDYNTFEIEEVKTEIPVITQYDIDYLVGNLL